MSAAGEALIVADIGGTHARFAIAEPGGAAGVVRLHRHARYLHEGRGDMHALLDRYLAEAGAGAPARACLAIAGPVLGERGQVINAGWRFSSRELATACGLAHVALVNDFAALAAAVPTCAEGELQVLASGAPGAAGPVSVVGPGTGFGVALLVPGEPRWAVVPTEGGHTGFAPADAEQDAMLGFLRRDHAFVEVESLLSGRGLRAIHAWLCARDGVTGGDPAPAEIGAAALAGSDARCGEAARCLLDLLAGVAGNVALLHGATGGVCFGGGVLEHLRPLIEPARFRARFAANEVVRDYLGAIPLRVILREHAALHGAAYLYRPPC
jgi:glucokinase